MIDCADLGCGEVQCVCVNLCMYCMLIITKPGVITQEELIFFILISCTPPKMSVISVQYTA